MIWRRNKKGDVPKGAHSSSDTFYTKSESIREQLLTRFGLDIGEIQILLEVIDAHAHVGALILFRWQNFKPWLFRAMVQFKRNSAQRLCTYLLSCCPRRHQERTFGSSRGNYCFLLMKATTIKPDTKSGLQFHLPISSSTMIVSCTLVMTFMEIWRLSRLFRFKKIDKSSLI